MMYFIKEVLYLLYLKIELKIIVFFEFSVKGLYVVLICIFIYIYLKVGYKGKGKLVIKDINSKFVEIFFNFYIILINNLIFSLYVIYNF